MLIFTLRSSIAWSKKGHKHAFSSSGIIRRQLNHSPISPPTFSASVRRPFRHQTHLLQTLPQSCLSIFHPDPFRRGSHSTYPREGLLPFLVSYVHAYRILAEDQQLYLMLLKGKSHDEDGPVYHYPIWNDVDGDGVWMAELKIP